MKTKQIQRLLAPALTLGLALTLAGCLFSPDSTKNDPDDVDVVLPVNAKNVLDLLIKSYVEKDIDAYTELFDIDRFIFRFDLQDVKDDPDLDEFWAWPEEFTSTKNMFDSELVLEVKLDFIKGATVFARESDDVPLEWRKVVCTNVQLDIDTVDPLGGENIIYKVNGDRGTYFFDVYSKELIEEQPRWRIVEWRDERQR